MRMLYALLALLFITPAAIADDPKGYLGVQIEYDDGAAAVRIIAVIGGSPAEDAKLNPDDRITEIDGKPVTGLEQFVEKIGSYPPGEEVELTVKRRDGDKKIKVKLGDRDADSR